MLAIPLCALLLAADWAGGQSPAAPGSPPIPEGYYAAIQEQIETGNGESAIRSLRERLQNEPKDLRLRNLLGVAYTSTDRLQEADLQFAAILSLDSRFVPALRNLAINEESLGDHKESVRHFQKVLTLRRKDPVASAYVGSDYFVRREFGNAYALLSQSGELGNSPTITMERVVSKIAIASDPAVAGEAETADSLDLTGIAPGLLFLGGAELAERGNYASAIRFFRALPSESQSNPGVVYNLALCLLKSHQGAEASRMLTDYLTSHPHTGMMLSLAAQAYVSTDKVQKAIDSLREATLLEPKVEDHFIDLAEICTQFDAYDVGIEVLDAGLHSLPQSERLYFEKGVLEAMKNDFVSADRDLAKAQQLSPRESMAALAVGVQLMQQGKLPQAIRGLRAKAAHDPNNAVVQYMLGEAILQNGAASRSPEKEEAHRALIQSAKGDDTYEPPLVALAKMAIEDQDFTQARHLLSKAVALAPNDSSAWSQLAVVDHRLGLKEEAESAVQRLSEINQKQRDERHQVKISSGPTN